MDNLIEVKLENAMYYALIKNGISEHMVESCSISTVDEYEDIDLYDFVLDLLDVMQERGLIKVCFF